MFSQHRKILKSVLFLALLVIALTLGACAGAGGGSDTNDTGGGGVLATETPMGGDTGGGVPTVEPTSEVQ